MKQYKKYIFTVLVMLVIGVCYSCKSGSQEYDLDLELAELAVDALPSETPAENQAEIQTEIQTDSRAESQTMTGAETGAETEAAPTPAQTCFVYVCGEVVCPGVYEAPAGSRIYELIALAGGVTEDAVPEALNLAEPVWDGMKLMVPDEACAESLADAGNTGGAGGTGNAGGATAQNTSGAVASNTGSAGIAANTGLAENTGLAGAPAVTDSRVNLNLADKEMLKTLPGIGDARAEAIMQYRSEYGGFSRIEDIMKVPGIKEAAFEKLKEYVTV